MNCTRMVGSWNFEMIVKIAWKRCCKPFIVVVPSSIDPVKSSHSAAGKWTITEDVLPIGKRGYVHSLC